MPLNSSLKVPCGCPRQFTSLPNRTTCPLPTWASTIETAWSRYCWPHAQPLRSGAGLSYHATGLTPFIAASGCSRNAGLSSWKTIARSRMP